MDENGKTTWVTHVRNLLNTNGFGHVWLAQGVGNKKLFLGELKQRLIDCFRQSWSSKLSESNRFSLYCTFKSSFGLEKYFESVTSNYVRTMYIRFRLGVSELKSNRYRYSPEASKKCPFCDNDEDEVHFLFHCTLYADLRQKYLSAFNLSTYRNQKLSILETECTERIVNLAKYVFYAFRRRRNSC